MGNSKDTGRFSSFGDFGSTFNRDQERRRGEEIKERFEKVASGKFSKIAKGNFQSGLEGVKSISIIPIESKSDGKWTLNIIPFYINRNSKEAHTTLQMAEDGNISGRMPTELVHSLEDIKSEVLAIIEKENVDFWHQTAMEIVPDKDMIDVTSTEDGGETDGGKYVDPERLAFYAQQSSALFGAVSRKDGFDGYKLIYFSGGETDFIVLDNELAPNAAFILDLKQKSETRESLNDEDKEALLLAVWQPIVSQARTK